MTLALSEHTVRGMPRRVTFLALPVVAFAFVLAGCGGPSAVEKATDDFQVESAAAAMWGNIVHGSGDDGLTSTADFIQAVRDVRWSKSHKRKRLEEEELNLVSLCPECYNLVRDELTTRY